MLVDEPPKSLAIDLCLKAWQDLNTCRQIGMAAGPIPWDRIVDWCQYHGLDREASDVIISVIQKLDNDHAASEASRRALADASKHAGT